jgi:hypothetical protein
MHYIDLRLQTPSVGPPLDAVKVTVHRVSPHHIAITGISSVHLSQPFDWTAPSDFEEFLASQPWTRKWCWQKLCIHGPIIAILQSIRLYQGNAVSDGSFKLQFSTSSWIIEATHLKAFITGSNIVPGFKLGHSSFRSELAGLYAIVFFITTAIEWYYRANAQSFTGTIEVGCDGLSALNQCYGEYDGFNSNSPDYDLIIAIRRRMAEFPGITWIPRHIESHQDDKRKKRKKKKKGLRSQLRSTSPSSRISAAKPSPRNGPLDYWAQKNVDMDHSARSYLEEQYNLLNGNPPQHAVDRAPWYIVLNGKFITKDLTKHINHHCTSAPILEFWSRRNRLGSLQPSDIDWDALEAAMKGMGTGFKREFIKHSTGYFSTGRNMFRWKKRNTDCCPRCLSSDENAEHIIQCSCQKSDELWDSNMREFDALLSELDTCPILQGVILSRLNTWRYRNSQYTAFPNAPSAIQRIVALQDSAGWKCAFEGRWVQGWSEIQAKHYRRIGSMRSAKQWLAKIIRQL